MDEYQERYLEHIKNKLKRKQTKHTYDVDSYIDLFENRKSIRRFNDVKVTDNILEILDYAVNPNTEEVFEDYLIGAVAIGNYE